MADNHSAAARLKHWRATRGISQKALADYLDVSISTISYWENGGILKRREQLMRRALQNYDAQLRIKELEQKEATCHGP